MTIKNKLILMLAIPLLALAVVSAVGFREQSSLAETNEDAQINAQSIVMLDELAGQIGTERLSLAAGESPSTVYPVARATDAMIDEIVRSGNSEAAQVAAAVDELIPAVRAFQTSELFAGYEKALELIDASNARQSLVGFTPDGVITVQSLAIARQSVNSQEASWFDYFDVVQTASAEAELVDGEAVDADAPAVEAQAVATSDAVAIGAAFGESDSLSDLAATATVSTSTQFFEAPTSSPASVELARLEARAVDGLVDTANINVDSADVFDALSDNRAEWNQAIASSGAFLIEDTNSQVQVIDDRRSLFTLLAVLGGLLLFTLIFVIGRSILGPMNRLMDHADLMTKERLPFAVAQLRTLGASDELPELRPIPKESNDEIGSLVDAFNEVQDTAVKVATDQARSRRNVAEMFVSLGRRNQQLNHRMLNLISELEQDEQNPEVLSGLYQLDHLATRMRRNAESLLVLAGNRSPRQWSRPVAMEDVVRSALAEVELFERVEVGELPDNFMHGNVVTDVTHLLAELLDNATQFSEPTTAVSISAHETLEGVEIEVFDEGFGVNEHDLAELNERISNPPALDEAPSRLLGLFVVGRLAQQHGIDVHLQSQPGVGTVATVSLPSSMFPDELIDRSTAIQPPSGLVAPPAIDTAEIEELREDFAVLASVDTDNDADLVEADLEGTAAWDPAAVHDEHLADASVPTMDEMLEAMPSFPGVTIDQPAVAAPVAHVQEAGDTWPLAKLEPTENDPVDPASTFSALEAIEEVQPAAEVETPAIADVASAPVVEIAPIEAQVAQAADSLDPFSLAPPLEDIPAVDAPVAEASVVEARAPEAPAPEAPVAESPVVEVSMAPPVVETPMAPQVVEAPITEVSMAPPVVETPMAPPVVETSEAPSLPAPPIMDPVPTPPPVAAPQPIPEPTRTDTFGGLPTRSPQAALQAVDATPALIPLESATPAEPDAKPAPPSAFAAFAFGVNRGLSDIKDEPKPQFSNEGDNA